MLAAPRERIVITERTRYPVRIKRSVAIGAALATVALAVPLLAMSASAATMPPWEPDPSALGSITFYNAAGQAVTGGTDDSFLADYAQASTTDPTGGTRAFLEFADPQPNLPTGLFFTAIGSVTTNFPNTAAPAPLNTSANPVVSLTQANGDANLAVFTGASVENTAAGFVNVYQVRLVTTAPGGLKGTDTTDQYWEDDVLVDPTTGSWSVEFPAPSTVTTTSTVLTADPATATAGVADTLTATVSPATAGSVQFFNGSTSLGTANVDASTGVATLSTTFASAGTQSLSAVFTPADLTDFSGSTGTLSLTVNASTSPTATTTKLAASPATAKVGVPETLTATETPAAAGSVAFKNGTTTLGTTAVNSTGVATLTHTFNATGKLSLSAVFTPSNTTSFSGSTGTLSLTVNPGTFKNTRKPSLGGPHEVTKRETVGIGTWSPKPTTVKYQWFLGSSKIKGATHSSYIIPKADRGKKIHVVVTVSASGFTTASASSNTVTVIGLPLRVVHRPALGGPGRVAHRETITKGTWSPGASRVTYQWYVAGKAVKGATKSSFVPTKADKGKLVKVVVTAIRAGFANGMFTSASIRIKAA
jgi:hypothetical protein